LISSSLNNHLEEVEPLLETYKLSLPSRRRGWGWRSWNVNRLVSVLLI
jgi:hypothetical protein